MDWKANIFMFMPMQTMQVVYIIKLKYNSSRALSGDSALIAGAMSKRQKNRASPATIIRVTHIKTTVKAFDLRLFDMLLIITRLIFFMMAQFLLK
jgi:hypothetical protein